MANKRRTGWLSCIGTLSWNQAGGTGARALSDDSEETRGNTRKHEDDHLRDCTPVRVGLAKSGAEGPVLDMGLGGGGGLARAGLSLAVVIPRTTDRTRHVARHETSQV